MATIRVIVVANTRHSIAGMARKGDSVKKTKGKLVRELLAGTTVEKTTIRVYEMRADRHVTEISTIVEGKTVVFYRTDTTTIEWGLAYASAFLRRISEGADQMLVTERNGTATTERCV